MTRLAARFASLKATGRGALVTFVTAGDPDGIALSDLLHGLVDSGADVLEVGLPFSDPIADGPVIQASSQRALDRGMTAGKALAEIAKFRERDSETPIVLMGYMNTVLRLGMTKFAKLAGEVGADGSIVCDLTPEEADDWITASQPVGLDNVFLVAPTSTEDRVRLAAEKASGFIYAVSRTGVTGAQANMASASDLVSVTRRYTNLPVCVGFGIRTRHDVESALSYADGAIVGSAIVDLLYKQGPDAAFDLVRSLSGRS